MADNTLIGPVAGGYMTPSYAWIVNPDTMEYGTGQLDVSGCSDAGNTTFRTTYLRPGLALGKITATGLYVQYAVGASDGTETIAAILAQGVDTLDPFGTARTDDMSGVKIAVKGHIDATQVILIDSAGKADLRTAGFVLKEDYE